MKTKPILFSTEMVQAIQEDRKTQTRRIAKELQGIKNPQFDGLYSQDEFFTVRGEHENGSFGELYLKKPISVGDILWVRETWSLFGWDYMEGFVNIQYKDEAVKHFYPDVDNIEDWIGKKIDKLEKKGLLESDPEDEERLTITGKLWEPSIFMPKWACRTFLEVTNVRVERLQDISQSDAKAEGIKYSVSGAGFCGYDYLSGGYNLMTTSRHSFFYLWRKIHGFGRYDELPNPWVWVYDFKRVKKPENFIA